MNRLAGLILDLTQRLLPPSLRDWGTAATREAERMERPVEAVAFALGCLRWAAGEAIAFHLSISHQRRDGTMLINNLLRGPRAAALWCGLAATGLGLVYMTMAGAPATYLMVNLGALVLGLLVLGFFVLTERASLAPGVLNALFGATLLAVSQFGVSADGVTRWLALGALTVQPGLVLVPVMLALFARSRDVLSMSGLILAALALALQPDRAMAGALAAGAVVLVFTRPNRNVLIVAGVAAAGFAATLALPDPSPAVPFVDRILYSSFDVHPMAGLAVLLGSALLIAPALQLWRAEADDRASYAVFGATWAAIVLAAALGNYPTPLVGYGGSAIMGYLVSLIAFPSAAPRTAGRKADGLGKPESEGPAMYVGAS